MRCIDFHLKRLSWSMVAALFQIFPIFALPFSQILSAAAEEMKY
jgi:hypothetical protein